MYLFGFKFVVNGFSHVKSKAVVTSTNAFGKKSIMQISDITTGRIEKVVYGGNGLIRQDNFVIFVPGTLPGEKVNAKITQLKKSYAIAELLEVVEASADRIEPNCRTTGSRGDVVRIPGCVYDHMSYEAEVAVKQEQLLEFVRYMPNARGRSSTLDISQNNTDKHEQEVSQMSNVVLRPLDPVPSPKELHYRNKLMLHVHSKRGSVKLGYQEERSHRVLDIPECPLSCEEINQKLHAIRSSEQFKKLPDKAIVTLRHTKADGILWWVNRPNQRSWITDESAIGNLRVSSDGFYQVNSEVSCALTETVAEWFKEEPTENILDLYCGIGLFGLACVKAEGGNLTGLESGKRAILAARHNAAQLGIEANFQVRELGKAQLILKQYTKDPATTTCIIDPPRAGMDKSVAETLASGGMPRIIYISCNPSTLQRDLKILAAEGGYRVKRIQMFDMFPRTAHFETVCELGL